MLSAWALMLFLKAAANRPEVNIRILTDEEKQQYITMRAATKHGVAIPQAKNKKATTKAAEHTKLLPTQLVLDPKHFQDSKGQPVPQISFTQVEAEAHGVAIATIDEITSFLQELRPDRILAVLSAPMRLISW